MKHKRIVYCVMLQLVVSPALADIVYTPVNPSFGGNPFNSSHLQSLATSQKQFTEHSSSGGPECVSAFHQHA